LESRPLGEWTLYETRVGSASVDFIVTGMGHENASRAADAALTEEYGNCVIAGFCGAVRPGYEAGDIVVADAVQRYRTAQTLECAKGLAVAARIDGAKASKLFLSVDEVIGTVEEKARLAPFAAAVDMESFAVMEIAHARGVPVVAIRAVSDTYDQNLPAHVDEMIDGKGRLKLAQAARTIVRHPLALPALMRLGRQSETGAKALAHFLEAFITRISLLSQVEKTEDLARLVSQ
jgi:adenosylhomocysteine nucleosidase